MRDRPLLCLHGLTNPNPVGIRVRTEWCLRFKIEMDQLFTLQSLNNSSERPPGSLQARPARLAEHSSGCLVICVCVLVFVVHASK